MKINTDLLELLLQIKHLLDKHHIRGYLIGGTIRDLLLHKTPDDIDILVESKCKEIISALAQKLHTPYFPLKEKFKIYRLVHSKFIVDFAELTEVSLEDNLKQRDFTLNSIAYPLHHLSAELIPGKLIDPLNGLDAIKKRMIQHNSDSIFMYDPVRLLRAFRMHLQLRCIIHPATLALISKNAHLISQSVPERIMAELIKIISYKHSAEVIEQLDRTHLLETIFPEITESKGCIQLGLHEFDVWEHSLHSFEKMEMLLNSLKEMFPLQLTQLQKYFCAPLSGFMNKKTALKLACLLHDIGKPKTRKLHKDGKRYSFINHQQVGANMVQLICKRLKLDNKSTAFIYFLVEHHLICGHYFSHSLISQRYLNRLFFKYNQDVIALAFIFLADNLSQKSYADPCPSLAFLSHLVHYYFNEFKLMKKMKVPVNGDDIMKKYHLPPGPLIGKILSILKEAQINGAIRTKRDCYKLIESKFPILA